MILLHCKSYLLDYDLKKERGYSQGRDEEEELAVGRFEDEKEARRELDCCCCC
jgi:hypothetical protein